jgi:hypothetical protein
VSVTLQAARPISAAISVDMMPSDLTRSRIGVASLAMIDE